MIKKVARVFIPVFVAVFATDFLIHGVLLKDMYMATAGLWRSESDMKHFMPFMMTGQLITAFFFSWIFMQGYKGKGWVEGVRYGLYLAGFLAGGHFMMYAVQPFPASLIWAWIVCDAAQGAVCGVVAAVAHGGKA